MAERPFAHGAPNAVIDTIEFDATHVALARANAEKAGYADRMDRFFSANPGFRSRIAHHIDFPDYTDDELGRIAGAMLDAQGYRLDAGAQAAMAEYVTLRRAQPHFANARSIRNALDRARLRQANRLFSQASPVTADDLCIITAPDLRASRVFSGGLDPDSGRSKDDAHGL